MSNNDDKENKTEEPTEKKRSETLERDGGPSSREVGSATALLVASAFLIAGSSGLSTLTQSLAVYIENPAAWRIDNGQDAVRLFQVAGLVMFNFLAPLVGAILIAGVVAAFLQNAPRLLTNRIMPDFSRVSPTAGLGRLFSPQTLVEFFKGVAKIAAAAFAAYAASGGGGAGLLAIQSPPEAIPELIRYLCFRVAFVCALLACIIAAADVFMVRRTWRVKLMMTKQEIKEEVKQSEGDQALKSRLRMIARSRIRRSMMANVPKATLVVTNPTHYAVALRYVRNEDSAPKVLAKGKDKLALAIRGIAEKHQIPVLENKALARSLFAAAEVDQLIPPEFYKAVAELIIYLDSKSRRPKRKTPPAPPIGLPPSR